jgi:quinol monooxygenase YgiN
MTDTNDEKRTILPFEPSTVETIDYALYNWINEEMNVFATHNTGFKKVPCIWGGGERAFQIKNNKDLRDDNGALIMPIITVSRTGMTKDDKRGMFYGQIDPKTADPVNGYFKGGSIEIARRIKQDKTQNFLNADSARLSGPINNPTIGHGQPNFPSKKKNKSVVYEMISVPMPTYVTVQYSMEIRTEYQQQMNEIMQPFITKTGNINYQVIKHEGHRYELFVDGNYNSQNALNELTEETRVYKTTFNLKVLGHLVGAGSNQESPKIVVTETATKVTTPRERTVFEDELPWRNGKLPR